MSSAIEFETSEASRLWRDYQRRLDHSNRTLSNEERREARAEAVAHIQDAMGAKVSGSEAEQLAEAIADYGSLPAAPPIWRKPVALGLHYGSIIVLGIGGMFLLMVLHMSFMEILNPEGVGLWVYPGDGASLSYEVQDGATEMLGGWFIPAALTIVASVGGLLFLLWRYSIAATGPVVHWMQGE